MLKYQLQFYLKGSQKQDGAEYDTKEAAMRTAETLLGGWGPEQVTLITWSVYPNLPRCKPDFVYRSCSMMVLRDVPGCYPIWYDCAIHDPHYQEWEA